MSTALPDVEIVYRDNADAVSIPLNTFAGSTIDTYLALTLRREPTCRKILWNGMVRTFEVILPETVKYKVDFHIISS